MQAHHRTTAILLAVLSIPFGIAIYQDANAEKSEGYYDGSLLGMFDESAPYQDYDYDYDVYEDYDYDNDELAELLAELEEEDIPEPEAMGSDFFNTIFFAGGSAKAPTLSGGLADLIPGSSFDTFEQRNSDYEDWAWNGLPLFEEATVEISTAASRVTEVTIAFPDDGSAARLMETQWGTPLQQEGSYEITRTWVNTDRKIRAQLVTADYDNARVTIAEYRSVEDFVAPRAKLFGFEKKDTFDLNREEIHTLLGQDAFYSESAILPPIGTMQDQVDLELTIEEDKIVELSTQISLGQQESKLLLRLLKTKLGKPKTQEDYESTLYIYKKGGRVVELSVYESDYETSLWHGLSIRRK